MSLSIVKTILGSISYKLYKTIIIIIIIVRRPIIIGLSNCLLFHLSAALHTHAQMRIKAKVYFGRPRTILITSFSSSRGLADSHTPRPSAGNFLRPRKSSWWFCACVELVRPHSSAAEYTLNAARTQLCTRRNGTGKVKKPLGFSSSLEMF